MPDALSSLPDAVLLAELRLSLAQHVGPLTRKRLVDAFGSAAAVLAASHEELRRVEGVGTKIATAVREAAKSPAAERELALCREFQIDLLSQAHPRFPEELKEIPDPPGLLFVRGEIRPEDNMALAVVGTRHASPYGKEQTERLTTGLAQAGLTIVSGLARGIDAVAHQAALQAGGRTIAVLGSGVLNIYPPEHAALAEEVIRYGALVSESPPQSPPLAGAFPQRNRIVTGMCLGVLVVEAAERSGALISARHALEQNRSVFAVPGRIDSRTSRGCHRLIRDGATLVESVDDILDELGPLPGAVPRADGAGEVHHPAELKLNEQEQQVLQTIGQDATSVDQIVLVSGLPVHRVLATLSVLEVRKLIRRLSATTVVRR